MRKAILLIFLLFSATHSHTFESGRSPLPSTQAAREKLKDTATQLPTPTAISRATPIPCVLLSDGFNDNSRDVSKWNRGVLSTAPPADRLAIVLEQNLRLEIQPRTKTAGNHYDGYVSASTWNLTNVHTSVEVVSAPTGGSDTIFAIGNDNNNYYRFVVSGELLYFQERLRGVLSQASIAFDASNHRFWRLRHDAGTDLVIFETSPNGVKNWNDRWAVQRHIPLTAVRVELSGGSAQSLAAPDKSIFDNLVQDNECPTPTPTPTQTLPPTQTPTPTPTRTPTPTSRVFNVIDYGGTPNDNTDDTAAFNRAKQLAGNNGEVHFSAGRFILRSSQTSDGRNNISVGGAVSIRITGAGMSGTNATTLKVADARARHNEEGITDLVQVTSSGTVELSNLVLEGPDDPRGGTWEGFTSYGIYYATNSGNLVLDSVKFRKFTHAIKVDGHVLPGGNLTARNCDISGLAMGILMTNQAVLRVEHTDFHDTGAAQEYVSPTDNLPKAKNDHHIYLYATVTAEILNCNFWNNGGFAIQKLEGGYAYTYVSGSRIGNEAVRNAGGSFYNGMPAPSADDPNADNGFRGRNVGQARGIETTFGGAATRVPPVTYVENSQIATNVVGGIVHDGLKLILVNVTFLKGNAVADGTLWNPKEIVLKNVAFNTGSSSVGFLSGRENFARIYMEDCTFSSNTTGIFLPKAQPHQVHWYGANAPKMSTFNTSNGGIIIHESGAMPPSMYARPALNSSPTPKRGKKLTSRETNRRNDPATQKSGLWKPGKNKLRFSTVPTAPTAADIS